MLVSGDQELEGSLAEHSGLGWGTGACLRLQLDGNRGRGCSEDVFTCGSGGWWQEEPNRWQLAHWGLLGHLSVSEIFPRGSFRGDGLLTWFRAPEAGTERVCASWNLFSFYGLFLEVMHEHFCLILLVQVVTKDPLTVQFQGKGM